MKLFCRRSRKCELQQRRLNDVYALFKLSWSNMNFIKHYKFNVFPPENAILEKHIVWCIKFQTSCLHICLQLSVFSKQLGQDIYFKAENWHALSHEQIFSIHLALGIRPWVFKDTHMEKKPSRNIEIHEKSMNTKVF